MKLLLRLLGMIALILIFVVAYLLTTNISKQPSDFNNQPQTIGQLGGYHLLDDIKIETSSDANFTRIAILTHLNRSTAIEGLDTPRTEAVLDGTSLRLKFFDTAFSDESQNEYLRGHQTISVNYPSRAQEVALTRPDDQDSQEVVVRLDRPTTYRLQPDPENAGVVFLDILE